MKQKTTWTYIKNIIGPCFLFAMLAGILSGLFTFGYRYAAEQIIHFSGTIYAYVRQHLYYIPVLLVILTLIALLVSLIVSHEDSAKGGGIPTAIGVMRGFLPLRWLRSFIATFASSCLTFVSGMSLGNEGSSVLLGTSLGKAITSINKKNSGWDRYIMTGGASASFAIVTNSPLSAIVFALEEFHHRFSPLLLFTCFTSISFATIIAMLLSSWTGVSLTFISLSAPADLTLAYIYLPIIIGLVMGLFAKATSIVSAWMDEYLFNRFLKKIKLAYRLIIVFVLTGLVGVFLHDAISSGLSLIETILDGKFTIAMLLLILLVKVFFTMFANKADATGGVFVPYLAMGAALGGVLAKICNLCGLAESFNTAIIVMAMVTFLASKLRAPLTAMVLAIEAFYSVNNIIFIIIAVGVASIVSEILKVESLNDVLLKNKLKKLNKNRAKHIIQVTMKVMPTAFVQGKMVRDILWPPTCLVLSINRAGTHPRMDRDGENIIRIDDELILRLQTFDLKDTEERLQSLLGAQNFNYVEETLDIIEEKIPQAS